MRNLFFLMALSLLVITHTKTVFADSEIPPHTYRIVSKDKKYTFVMRQDSDARTYQLCRKGQPCLVSGEQIETLLVYPKSGLYSNDAVPKPLWTVDWYAYQVYLSADGVHVARMGPWARLSPSKTMLNQEVAKEELAQLAVAFYENGVMIKEYSIADVIKEKSRLPQSISHFMWYTSVTFDDEQELLSITTTDNEKCTFDLKTGVLIERKSL